MGLIWCLERTQRTNGDFKFACSGETPYHRERWRPFNRRSNRNHCRSNCFLFSLRPIVLAVLECTRKTLNSQRSSCLCFLGAGIKGVLQGTSGRLEVANGLTGQPQGCALEKCNQSRVLWLPFPSLSLHGQESVRGLSEGHGQHSGSDGSST